MLLRAIKYFVLGEIGCSFVFNLADKFAILMALIAIGKGIVSEEKITAFDVLQLFFVIDY